MPALLAMDDVVDLIIPRGGPGLQALVKEHARMPVIYGGIGVCHIYVDASADLEGHPADHERQDPGALGV